MLLVLGICEDCQEVLIARHTPDIFWGTGALPANAARVFGLILERKDVLQDDVVLPIVAEVVLIQCPGVGDGEVI